MRALHFSALAAAVALALGGCSRQPPPMQPAPPCIDLKGTPCAVAPDVSHPTSWVPDREDVRMHRRANRHKRPHRHVEDRNAVMPRRPQAALTLTPVSPELSASLVKGTPPPAPPVVEQPATRTAGAPPAAPAASAANASVQEQVAVAAALAERITALSRLPVPNAKDQPAERSDVALAPSSNRLVAVLMVRPGVRAVPELRGRVIAIDERYAAAHDKVAIAMALAGASDIQLMQGQGTAINRLTNGEVAAAVVALVAPEAAEAFPEIAGFRIFRIPI